MKTQLLQLELLPAMPVVARQLLALDLESIKGERELVQLINQDPLLLARIVGLANSPAYGPKSGENRSPVVSADKAAMMIGYNKTKQIALAAAIEAAVPVPASRSLRTTALWQHSLQVAEMMNEISQWVTVKSAPSHDLAFLAGMMHDIGLAVVELDPLMGDGLFLSKHQNRNSPHPLTESELEMDLMGITHAELGALLAECWSLPAIVSSAIRGHHNPQLYSGDRFQLVRMTAIAERLASQDLQSSFKEISRQEWESIGIVDHRVELLGNQLVALSNTQDGNPQHKARLISQTPVANTQRKMAR